MRLLALALALLALAACAQPEPVVYCAAQACWDAALQQAAERR